MLPFKLQPYDVQIWSTTLTLPLIEVQAKRALLSSDELARADRFRLPLHQQRFIIARGTLREILGGYLDVPPQQVQFGYSDHHKPYLLAPDHMPVQFNLAHSDDIAVYAFTLQHAIGIDIEKMSDRHDSAKIAQRFFSAQENAALAQLPAAEQMAAFYRLWSRKEALIKAVGKGLSIPLDSFSVSVQAITETIYLENNDWTLMSLETHSEYQAALASNQITSEIQYQSYPLNKSSNKR